MKAAPKVVAVVRFALAHSSSKPKLAISGSGSSRKATLAKVVSSKQKPGYNLNSLALDQLMPNNAPKSYGNSNSSIGLAGSACWFVCVGGGRDSSGHSSVTFGVGPEVGVNGGASLSPDVSMGWSFGIECTAAFFSLGIGTGGLDGNINAIPTKAGCSVKGKLYMVELTISMQDIKILTFINFGVCVALLMSGMFLGYLLFRSLKERHPKYYKLIGEPIIFAPINVTEKSYAQLLKGGAYVYSMVFRGIPKKFPKDGKLRKLAQTIRVALGLLLVSSISLVVIGYLFYKSTS